MDKLDRYRKAVASFVGAGATAVISSGLIDPVPTWLGIVAVLGTTYATWRIPNAD